MVLLCTMLPMAKSKQKSRYTVPEIVSDVKPEIRSFLQRAFKICDARNVSHFGMSRRLFDGQPRALENLAAGNGANVLGYLDAKAELGRYEDDPNYWPAESESRRPKPKTDRQPVSA